MSGKGSRKTRYVQWLLLIPYIAMLLVPLYNRYEPSFLGIPFFYWYQLMWIPLGALIVGIVYWATVEQHYREPE